MARQTGSARSAKGTAKNTPIIKSGKDHIQKKVSANMKHACQHRIVKERPT